MGVSLNADQRKAVEHQGGPLLVVAGPGSGKTRVIIERVMHLVKKGLKPSEILCLTFSEKAAGEMKQRLEKLIDVTEMDISTFHSFAKDVLEDNVLDSGIGLSSGVIKRSAQLVWGLKNIDNFGFKHLEIGNNAVEVIESIIDGISTFKDELVSPKEIDEYVEKKLELELSDEERDFVLKLSDMSKVYHRYQAFQRSKAVIDFDDMVVQAIELFKRKQNVISKYRKKYKHILVDEFQDNNFAQLELVKLVGQSGNVTVVGDDDQSIYRFQGAYLTNFQDFKSFFPNTAVVTLNQNYRSTGNIVSIARDLLSSVQDREPKKLHSENEDGDKISIAACATESAEVEFVVDRIREMLGRRIKRRDGAESPLTYKDFVIVSRRKLEGKKFSKALKAYGIPTVYIGEANIFSSPIIRDLMAYLRIASSPTTAGIEITRLMKNHGITEQNIARINHAAKKKARADPTNMDFVYETLQQCDNLGITQNDEAKELVEQLQNVMKLENQATISEFVYKVMMSMSDLYRRSVQSDDLQSRRNQLLKEMYSIALEYESLNPQGTLDDFIKYLSLMGQFDLELAEGYESQDAVQVTTIHQTKGREFPVVFVVDVAANKLPLRYQAKTFYVPNDLSKGIKREEDEKELYVREERRLFYVAMTRAQNRLFVTYARRYGQNARETKPSKFLEEIDFRNNASVELLLFDGSQADTALEAEERIERLKHELQEKAVRSINQMQLKTAVQRLIELAKVKYFEENGSIDGFDPQKTLVVDNTDGNLEAELAGKRIAVVNRDELRLSASAIKTYVDCPLKFKFSHILGVPEPPRPYFDIGTAVHAVAEHMTKMQLEGTEPTEELAIELLKREWNPSSFQSETQENQAREKAKEMLQTYLKWLSCNPNSPVAAEQEFTIDIAGIPFHGFIDRIEKRPDGTLEVVDFKTGGVYESAKSIREDPQVNIYALGVQKIFNKLPNKASLFYIKHDKTVTYDVGSSQVEKVKEEVEKITNAIIEEKFEATPSFEACRNCSFRGICDSRQSED